MYVVADKHPATGCCFHGYFVEGLLDTSGSFQVSGHLNADWRLDNPKLDVMTAMTTLRRPYKQWWPLDRQTNHSPLPSLSVINA